MELDQFKALWYEQDKKLDKNLQLNIQLLRNINLDKAGFKLKKLFMFKIVEMVILVYIIVYLFNFTIKYILLPGLSISSMAIITFIVAGFISDFRQMVLIIDILSNDNLPIFQLQKKIQKLKLLIINYVKNSFLLIPFYPLLMIVIGKILFGFNFWMPSFRIYLFSNIVVGILLLPLFLWLYRQLGSQNIKNVWIKSFLDGSGWNQVKSAQQFLAEIENFERNE